MSRPLQITVFGIACLFIYLWYTNHQESTRQRTIDARLDGIAQQYNASTSFYWDILFEDYSAGVQQRMNVLGDSAFMVRSSPDDIVSLGDSVEVAFSMWAGSGSLLKVYCPLASMTPVPNERQEIFLIAQLRSSKIETTSQDITATCLYTEVL